MYHLYRENYWLKSDFNFLSFTNKICYETKNGSVNLTNAFFNSTIQRLIENDHFHELWASCCLQLTESHDSTTNTSRSTESVLCDSVAAGGRHSSPWESGFQRQRNRRKRDGESVIRVIYWPVLLGEARGSDWLALTHSARCLPPPPTLPTPPPQPLALSNVSSATQ